MMTASTLTDLASRLASEIPGVQSASAWTRVPGREAVYVELTKRNGGRNWNGGAGRVLVVSASGAVEWKRGSEWAGAATRHHHDELGTVEAIKALVATYGATAEVEAALAQ